MPKSYDDLGPDLLIERHDQVLVLTMNGPERLNAVDDGLHQALSDVWELVALDDNVGAVVLTGAGRAFCAGGYYPNLLRNHGDAKASRRSLRNAERLAREIIGCEVPIVAAVNGAAVGLGASLATMCDIVVMSDKAYLCDPHVNIGVVAGDGGTVSWPLLTSLLNAKEYLLLGDRIAPAECVRLGLANRAVEHDALMPTALELARRLAAQPRQAVRDTKRALNSYLQRAAESVLPFALAAESESFFGDDIRKTIERFNQLHAKADTK